jgi:hypothetical protein
LKIQDKATSREFLAVLMPGHEAMQHSMVSFDDGHGIMRVACSCGIDEILLDREVEAATGRSPSWVADRLRALGRERRAA